MQRYENFPKLESTNGKKTFFLMNFNIVDGVLLFMFLLQPMTACVKIVDHKE